jgi:alpha-glucosidase
LHEAVRKAAHYELMVDIHDEYRPTGYSRTYPNLMTQEGVRGDEESPSNEMVINTIFTRMIAGAADQTNCYFAERVYEKMGSHASQMAKAICIYSPWQFLYWYDRPTGSPTKKGGAGGAEVTIPEIPDLGFYDRLPTTWDQTKVMVGKLAVLARKKESTWYLGAIVGTADVDIKVPLNFLDKGVEYEATFYSDNALLKSLTNLKIETAKVSSETILEKKILKQNGLAIIFSQTKTTKK